MSNDEKMNLMAEVLDMDVSEISPTTKLDDLDAWDSVAALAFIAMMDERFKKAMKGSELRSFETVQDALNVMQ
jgi:acyl carrier protein